MMNRYQAGVYLHTNIPKRSILFFNAWMIVENGWSQTVPNNNPANISYQGGILPNEEDKQKYPWFRNVTQVLDNRVCIYDTLEHGCDATIQLLLHYFPHVVGADTDEQALEALGEPDVNGEHWASNPNYSKELLAVFAELEAEPGRMQPALDELSNSHPEYHQVVGGDCVDSLAKHYGTTESQILKWNPEIVNPNQIFVGQTLRVK